MGVDVTPATFEAEVIQRSHEVPVVVDFWAPWCGPCRVLGPVLEALEAEAGGDWQLVKINTQDHPQLAQQFGIQGIPAVKAFRNGQQIDEFVGALPKPAVAQWLEGIVPSAADEAVAQADSLRASDPAAALALYQQALADKPGHIEGLLGAAELTDDADLARALLARDRTDRASGLIAGNGPHAVLARHALGQAATPPTLPSPGHPQRVHAQLAHLAVAPSPGRLPDTVSVLVDGRPQAQLDVQQGGHLTLTVPPGAAVAIEGDVGAVIERGDLHGGLAPFKASLHPSVGGRPVAVSRQLKPHILDCGGPDAACALLAGDALSMSGVRWRAGATCSAGLACSGATITGVHTGLCTFDTADIGDTFKHLRAHFATALRGVRQGDSVAIAQHQPRALFGVGKRNGGADSAAGTGDHGALVVQLHSIVLNS